MSVLYGTGQYFNVLSRPNVVVTPTNVNTAFPTSRLYDDRCGDEFRFNAIGTDQTIVVSGNLLPDPGAESSGAGWSSATTGTGAATILGSGDTGTKAFQCTAGTGSATWFVDILVRSGDRLKIDARMAENSTGTARLRIRNLTSGNLLTSGAAWSATLTTDVFTATTTAYTTNALQFQVESMDICHGQAMVLLRVSLIVEGAVGVAQFDTLGLYAGVNFASLHGWGGGMGLLTLTIESNATWDGTGAYTSRATMVKEQGQFYSSFTVIYALWWRLKLTGTSLFVPTLGEMILGFAETATFHQSTEGYTERNSFPQTRYESLSGDVTVYSLSTSARQELTIVPFTTSDATYQELRDELFRRSNGGLYPMIYVPVSTEPLVYHGRLQDEIEIDRQNIARRTSNLRLISSGMPASGL